MSNRANAFEALCNLASIERWCWKIGCRTCGCMHFRAGLKSIAAGDHPLDVGWQIHKDTPAKIGPQFWDVEPTEQLSLVAIASSASLKQIFVQCRFPDWLGYMGLVLFAYADDNNSARSLTNSWVPQLRMLVADSTSAAAILDDLLDNHDLSLTWKDLTVIKRGIIDTEMVDTSQSSSGPVR